MIFPRNVSLFSCDETKERSRKDVRSHCKTNKGTSTPSKQLEGYIRIGKFLGQKQGTQIPLADNHCLSSSSSFFLFFIKPGMEIGKVSRIESSNHQSEVCDSCPTNDSTTPSPKPDSFCAYRTTGLCRRRHSEQTKGCVKDLTLQGNLLLTGT